jgi:hypothetical protein
MPISCPQGDKPRYRAKKTDKGTIRLAFCGNKVVEAKKLHKKAKARRGLGRK